MRIALHHSGEVGLRCGQILLAEPQLTALGLVDRRPSRKQDPRVEAAVDLGSYDVLVSDDIDEAPEHTIDALEAGVHCVLWDDAEDVADQHAAAFATAGLTLLTGANLGSGVAASLGAHEAVRQGEVLGRMWASTEPGRPLRRGEAIPFPEPVGALWGRRRPGSTDAYMAPVEGEWAAAMAKVTTGTPDGLVSRIVGVADLALHLEALALAAAVLAIADYPFGAVGPTASVESYLATALRVGLEVAAHELHEH